MSSELATKSPGNLVCHNEEISALDDGKLKRCILASGGYVTTAESGLGGVESFREYGLL